MSLSWHSVRLRLALLAGAVVAVAGVGVAWAAHHGLAEDLARADLEFARHEVLEVSHVIAGLVDPAQVRERLRRSRPAVFPEEGVERLEVRAPDGAPVLCFPEGAPPPPPWAAGLEAAVRQEFPAELLDGDPPAARAALGVFADERPRWTVERPRWVIVAQIGRGRSMQALAALRQRLLLVVPTAVLAVTLGGYGLLSLALWPLRRLVADARALAEEGPGRRLATLPAGSELAELVALLNRMLAHTEETLGRLERFAADASHELRTPLTRIRGEAEVALRDGRPEQARAALESVLDEVDGLRRLVDGLLQLTAGEAPSLTAGAVFDLGALVEALVPEAALLGELRGVAVTGRPAGPVAAAVRGSPDLIKRAVWNLLDNALKYAPAGARVEVTVEADAGAVRCVVADDGPGVPEALRPRLFEPFARAAEARAQEGHGLGLALARTIARRHGGDLALAPSTVGARFVLTLPRAAAAATRSLARA